MAYICSHSWVAGFEQDRFLILDLCGLHKHTLHEVSLVAEGLCSRRTVLQACPSCGSQRVVGRYDHKRRSGVP